MLQRDDPNTGAAKKSAHRHTCTCSHLLYNYYVWVVRVSIHFGLEIEPMTRLTKVSVEAIRLSAWFNHSSEARLAKYKVAEELAVQLMEDELYSLDYTAPGWTVVIEYLNHRNYLTQFFKKEWFR